MGRRSQGRSARRRRSRRGALGGPPSSTVPTDPDALIDHGHRVAYDHRASMLQDIEGRRATEIDFLNGGIARFGAEEGVPTPLNETIAALIKGVERSWAA